MKRLKNAVKIAIITSLFLLLPSLNAQELKSIVQVSKHNSMSCSGTVVENEDGRVLVLSCAHVFFIDKTNSKTQVRFYRDDGYFYSYPAKMLKKNDDWDLSLIEVKGNINVKAFPIRETMPDEGKVRIYGYGSKGIRNHYATIGFKGSHSTGGEPLLMLNGEAISGLSGTAFLFEDAIIGVQSAGSKTKVFGSNCETIQKFLSN